MPSLLLIDGNSLAYRAYFALPATLKTSSGEVTNALYGFTTMLLKVLEEKPDYIATAFDLPEPTFRHREFAGYKAKRERAPEDLREQLPRIKEMVAAFGIPIMELAGFEADDVIGTLARSAEKKGINVTIVSGDLDPLQLVDDKVSVLTTLRGITDTILYDEKEVKARYGLIPSQLPDFKGLKGDPSDNIPGVPGIGEKTAIELLSQFGTLEEILVNLEKVKPEKLRELIKNNTELAVLSKHLATIVTDAPVELDNLSPFTANWEKVLPLFERYEFGSLLKKYGRAGEPLEASAIVEKKREKIKEAKVAYRIIDTESALAALAEELSAARYFALDTETTSPNPFKANLVGISFSFKPNEAYYLPIGHRSGKQLPISFVREKLLPAFQTPNVEKLGHNLKYDLEVLEKAGLPVEGEIFDTMVAAYLLNPESENLSLKKLAALALKRGILEFEDLVGSKTRGQTMADIAIDLAADYSGTHADATLQLALELKDNLASFELLSLFKKFEMPFTRVLIEMEKNGVFIDTGRLKKISDEFTRKIRHLETEIFAIAGEVFNLNSPKQLQKILFDKLKLPAGRRTKTGRSTDAAVLESLARDFEIAQKLLEYRQISKLKSGFVDALPQLTNSETGRVHTSFNQTVTATGRLSSSNPNLQNIPAKGEWGKKIREAFVPQKPNRQMVAADYSQIELRILAHLSEDPELIKAFSEGQDVHALTAAEVFNVPLAEVTPDMRNQAKVVNFGIIYGMSDFGLARSLGIKRSAAAEYIERYFKRHAGVKTFIENTLAEARQNGYVTTLLGRRRYLPAIRSHHGQERAFAERAAINTPIQGTAADLIKVAMISLQQKLKNYSAKMILQVHDELVFEAPENELPELRKIVEQEMSHALPLKVPVRVEIGAGRNWAEAKGLV